VGFYITNEPAPPSGEIEAPRGARVELLTIKCASLHKI